MSTNLELEVLSVGLREKRARRRVKSVQQLRTSYRGCDGSKVRRWWWNGRGGGWGVRGVEASHTNRWIRQMSACCVATVWDTVELKDYVQFHVWSLGFFFWSHGQIRNRHQSCLAWSSNDKGKRHHLRRSVSSLQTKIITHVYVHSQGFRRKKKKTNAVMSLKRFLISKSPREKDTACLRNSTSERFTGSRRCIDRRFHVSGFWRCNIFGVYRPR